MQPSLCATHGYGVHMSHDVAIVENGPFVDAATLLDVIGWEHKPEGLCKDDACVIVPESSDLLVDGQVDVTVAAGLLDRPAVFDTESGVVAVGVQRQQRRSALADLTAPDFELPDLDGTSHALSDHRSKKRLLVAFSSW